MADAKLPRGALAAGLAATVGSAAPVEDALTAAFPVVRRSVLRDSAKHILMLGDLAAGIRCPACHALPERHRYDHAVQRSRYTCGCGLVWKGHRWAADDRTRSIERSLKLLAAGKPLPDLPAKEDADA